VIDLETFLFLVPILLLSLVLHELAHAVSATALGDPTPREHGRLTLNPLAHLDPLGTLILVITILTAPFAFGWAKPVVVTPRYFRRAKEGMALVAAAGPAVNFALALACLAPIRFWGVEGELNLVLSAAFIVNVVLGVFNLFPIPPLDGSRIVGVFMDRSTYARWVSLDQYGFVILIALIVVFRDPFQDFFSATLDVVAGLMGLRIQT
jgi:Zn-dependent protease